MSGPTYGPDMFAMDLPQVDPQTVLNEPMPRAWGKGGVIESVKTAVVTGVENAFRNSTMAAVNGEDPPFYISIEYPTDVTKYPGLWVQFAIEKLIRSGLAMETWTKDDDGNWGSIQTWSFDGRITLTTAALTSKDRDRLADAVLAQLAFSRPPDLVIRDPRRDAKQMKGLLATLDENPYVSMTLNTDVVVTGGESAAQGAPWARNEWLYENTWSVTCHGQFNMRFSYDGVYELAEIRPNPSLMGDNVAYRPEQWRGMSATR